MSLSTAKCPYIHLLAIGFTNLLLFYRFLLINNSYDNNYQCQVQLDMINKQMQAHNLYVNNAIHLLEYQKIININIKNLETEMDLLFKTKYII